MTNLRDAVAHLTTLDTTTLSDETREAIQCIIDTFDRCTPTPQGVIVWDVEDIVSYATVCGEELDSNSALTILTDIIYNHDCNYGITWGVIENIILAG